MYGIDLLRVDLYYDLEVYLTMKEKAPEIS